MPRQPAFRRLARQRLIHGHCETYLGSGPLQRDLSQLSRRHCPQHAANAVAELLPDRHARCKVLDAKAICDLGERSQLLLFIDQLRTRRDSGGNSSLRRDIAMRLMLGIVLLLAWVCFAPSAPVCDPCFAHENGIQREQAGGPKKLALLVGIGNYERGRAQPPDWWNLNSSADVAALKAVLIEKFGFHAADILVLEDKEATREGITTAFQM